MNRFKIIPLPEAVAAQVRQTRRDAFGNHVLEQTATGYGPCRLTLTPFKPGVDQRLLLAYSPFSDDSIYAEKGPIFISADQTKAYADVDRFPPEIKVDPINFPLSLLGYTSTNQMCYTRLVGADDVDELLNEALNKQPEIAYLHVRNSEACCFICAVERA